MNTIWMNSKRKSECSECEGDIYEGDRIVWDSDEYKAYCNDCGVEVAGEDPYRRGGRKQ